MWLYQNGFLQVDYHRDNRLAKKQSPFIGLWCSHSVHLRLLIGFHDNSYTDFSSTTLRLQTFRLQTFRLQTFRLLLYTSVYYSYTSNFCFSKSLFLSISTSVIPFYQPHFHWHYDNTTYIVSKHCGMTIQLVLSVKDAYFYQSHF